MGYSPKNKIVSEKMKKQKTTKVYCPKGAIVFSEH
jgi:hypothetical protein